jgi:hypothetical protein
LVTVTVIESDPGLLLLSVTDAVIVWVPADRLLLNEPPAPIVPSILDVQLSDPVSVPSSVSVALPAKLMLAPSGKLEPSLGDEIATDGESLVTVILIASEPGNPPESVTEAVIVWVPADRLVLNEPPAPIVPSILDVQLSEPVSVPSSRSVALPVKPMLAPSGKLEPSAGAVIETVGGVFICASASGAASKRSGSSKTGTSRTATEVKP